MSKVVIDLSNYKDRVGSRVPEGRYRVQVEDVEEAKSKSGNTMINLWFRIMGGEEDGKTIIDRLPLTDNAMFRVVGFMQALGIPTPKKRLSIDISKWNGQVLDIDVEDGEPYNGRIRSEVRSYSKAQKSSKAEAADDLDLDDEDDFEEAEEVEVEEEQTEEKPKKKARKKKAEPEPEDSDDAEDDDDSLGVDDLEDVDLDEVEL